MSSLRTLEAAANSGTAPRDLQGQSLAEFIADLRELADRISKRLEAHTRPVDPETPARLSLSAAMSNLTVETTPGLPSESIWNPALLGLSNLTIPVPSGADTSQDKLPNDLANQLYKLLTVSPDNTSSDTLSSDFSPGSRGIQIRTCGDDGCYRGCF